jgi:hypothetical protein
MVATLSLADELQIIRRRPINELAGRSQADSARTDRGTIRAKRPGAIDERS